MIGIALGVIAAIGIILWTRNLARKSENRIYGMPEWVAREFPLVQKISVNGCNCRHQAENDIAHTMLRRYRQDALYPEEQHGSICFNRAHTWTDDYPSPVFLHEYAHLEAGIGRESDIHDGVWENKCRELLREWGYDEDAQNAYSQPIVTEKDLTNYAKPVIINARIKGEE